MSERYTAITAVMERTPPGGVDHLIFDIEKGVPIATFAYPEIAAHVAKKLNDDEEFDALVEQLQQREVDWLLGEPK